MQRIAALLDSDRAVGGVGRPGPVGAARRIHERRIGQRIGGHVDDRELPSNRECDSLLARCPGDVVRREPRQIRWEIELPLLARPLAVAAGLAFAVALGEFGATVFVVRADWPTVPVAIFIPTAYNWDGAVAPPFSRWTGSAGSEPAPTIGSMNCR